MEIIREVIRDDHDLVLRVNKGKESRRQGFFGNTGMRLLRKCPCAVWLVSRQELDFSMCSAASIHQAMTVSMQN